MEFQFGMVLCLRRSQIKIMSSEPYESKSQALNPQPPNPKPESRNPKPYTKNPKP